MRQKFSILALILVLGLALSMLGCGGGGNGSSPLTSVPTGNYGGTNIGLAVTAAGGVLSLPCGSVGAITTPLTLDANGNFNAAGTITPVSGGVQPTGSTPKSYAATFTGTTNGTTVNLTITPDTSTGLPAVTYSLTRGAAPDFTALCPQ